MRPPEPPFLEFSEEYPRLCMIEARAPPTRLVAPRTDPDASKVRVLKREVTFLERVDRRGFISVSYFFKSRKRKEKVELGCEISSIYLSSADVPEIQDIPANEMDDD